MSDLVWARQTLASSARTRWPANPIQDTLTSSIGTAPPLLGLGSTAFASEIVDGGERRVLTFPLGGGVAVPQATEVISTTYTIVALFRLHAVTGYRRIADFKNQTSDTGLYDLSGSLNFYNYATGPSTSIAADAYVRSS
jgi:hypothetical protein